MKVIFGLGNPGSEYRLTRHNTGFTVIDNLAVNWGVSFSAKPKFKAEVAEYSSANEKIVLVKPLTFYNDVGECLRTIIEYYKLSPADALVIHDDVALPFGILRARIGGSDAGNNGIKSVNLHGGSLTARLKVGVGSQLRTQMGDVDFVLGRFSADEAQSLELHIIPACRALIFSFINGGYQPTSQNTLPPAV